MSIQAMKQALEALESFAAEPPGKRVLHPEAVVITALRDAIEQMERAEPVGEVRDMKYGFVRFYGKPTERKYLPEGTKLYTHPPQSPVGDVVITTTESGECVAVTRRDDNGRTLKVLWEKDTAQKNVSAMATAGWWHWKD